MDSRVFMKWTPYEGQEAKLKCIPTAPSLSASLSWLLTAHVSGTYCTLNIFNKISSKTNESLQLKAFYFFLVDKRIFSNQIT